jgi:hypothetical protein
MIAPEGCQSRVGSPQSDTKLFQAAAISLRARVDLPRQFGVGMTACTYALAS